MSGNKQQSTTGEPDDTSIKIKAVAKRNGLTTFLIGVCVLGLAILLLALLPKSVYMIGIFALSGGIVTMLIGWFKVREPLHSFELTKSYINYQHRHGHWQLNWTNIQRIDVPNVNEGLDSKALSMIGIRIRDYASFLATVSPRLATNLLLEQRALLLLNDTCATGGCYNNDLIENDHCKLDNGQVIRGIPAMLANRMKKLRSRLGYDIYVSASELDRSADEFVALMKQCHSQVIHTAIETADSE